MSTLKWMKQFRNYTYSQKKLQTTSIKTKPKICDHPYIPVFSFYIYLVQFHPVPGLLEITKVTDDKFQYLIYLWSNWSLILEFIYFYLLIWSLYSAGFLSIFSVWNDLNRYSSLDSGQWHECCPVLLRMTELLQSLKTNTTLKIPG